MLKIFGVVNHLGNQAEMLKLAEHYDVEFTYLENNVRKWSKYHETIRPIPKHLKWATYYEPNKYDLAILHVDQQHVNPNIGKGMIYRQMNEVIQDIPKMVINHGTPMYDELYDENMVINGGTIHGRNGPMEVEGMKKLIGDNFMVVNSYDSVSRWGWGYPLIHGMDIDEWYDLPKEPRAVIMLSPGGLDKYYGRGLLTDIKKYTKELYGDYVRHITVDPLFWQSSRTAGSFEEYREYIGRSLLYINPTKDSPMPRSRTEAMLSGACVLTSRYHNADEFIVQGENGFIIPDNPVSYAETITYLINEKFKYAEEVGQKGKETARKYFKLDTYLKDLWFLVNEVAKGNKPKWDGKKRWDV